MVRLLPFEDDLAPAFEALACFGALSVLVFLGADIGSSTGAAAAVRFWFRLRFAIMYVGLVVVLVVVLTFGAYRKSFWRENALKI